MMSMFVSGFFNNREDSKNKDQTSRGQQLRHRKIWRPDSNSPKAGRSLVPELFL